MQLFNVLRPNGTAINRNPVNAVQAKTMVKIFKLNYGFEPTIQEL
jgi:hypothetical protein